MKHILLASHNGNLYQLRVLSEFDVADMVRAEHPNVLSSTDGAIDFWFAHDPRLAVNHGATEMLLANTRFTAHDVPLLRGDVVIGAHDPTGKLASLSDIDMQTLLSTDPSRQDTRILARRFDSDRAAQRRRARRASTASALRPIRGL